jgi:hypothetical protein
MNIVREYRLHITFWHLADLDRKNQGLLRLGLHSTRIYSIMHSK